MPKNPTKNIYKLGEMESVTVTGTVPDTRDFIKQCSVAVVPVRIGSGIKGKIIEAMAMGRPVVTTPIGEGMKLVNEENVLIAQDDKELIRYCIRILSDGALRKKLSINGRKHVEKYFGIESNYGEWAHFISKTRKDSLKTKNIPNDY